MSADVVGALLARAAGEFGGAPALLATDGSTVASYGALAESVGALAERLRCQGVGPGDHVAVLGKASAACLVGILAAMSVGVAVPVNPALGAGELRALLAGVSPKVALCAPSAASAVQRLGADLGVPIWDVSGPFGAVAGSSRSIEIAPDAVALMLHTAGTTGVPKSVPLTHRQLATGAWNVVASLELTPGDRCLNVMPLFHSHGLIGCALSTLVSGGALVCAERMHPTRFLGWAAATAATWYSAAPAIHRMVSECPGAYTGFRLARSASAPLPVVLAEALERRLEAPVIEVYGMTEAYQIAANPLPPGERRLGTVGLPTGTEVRVVDPSGASLPAESEGEVVVRGGAVFSGYAAPPGANDDAFFDDWFRTGDLGRLSADGYLTITGRVKEQINRAGEKISPREVEEAVLCHPSIADAAAFAVPDDAAGEAVGIAVVVRDGHRFDAVSLRRHVGEHIAAFKVPQHVHQVESIPRSPTGKILRRELAGMVAPDVRSPRRTENPAGPGRPPESQANAVETALGHVWMEVLDLEAPPEHSANFFDLGGDSLALMEMVARIETQFGVEFPMVDIAALPVFGEVVSMLTDGAGSPASSSLLQRYRAGAGDTALVLIPGQLGSALGLRAIADLIDVDVDVMLFDYPGLRAGEAPLQSVAQLGAVLADAVRAKVPQHRIAFYGNSLGGWLAVEAAERLRAGGREVVFSAVGDMYSGFLMRRFSRTRLRELLRGSRLDEQEIDDPVLKGMPKVFAARITRVRRSSERARRLYRARAYPGDLVVFSASSRRKRFGPTLGWERNHPETLETVELDADHGSMHVTHAAQIAAVLGRRLGR